MNHPSEPLSIDVSRCSGRTKLLVKQALDEQERIGWDKAFRGYLSLTWGLFKAPHEDTNPYSKTLQPSAWVISTLTNLGKFSKAIWKERCTKLYEPNNTSSPTSDLDANCYANPQDLLAADRQLLNRPISTVLKSKRTHKTKFIRSIYAAPIVAFFQSASIGSILYAISSTHQFPLLHSLILTLVFHKLYSQIPRGPALAKMDPARVE